MPPAGCEEGLDSKRVHSRPAERIWQAAEVPVMPVPMMAMRFLGVWAGVLVRSVQWSVRVRVDLRGLTNDKW